MATKQMSYETRMRWFHQARFGMFIHWGLYSIIGRGEWVMFVERIPKAEYANLADLFNPSKFDADAWAGLAAEAGAKYMVLTTRHHDGFCLFDSQVSDFTAPKTAAKRDFVAEYAEACRKAGLKVGFYYSLLDWRFPGYHDPEKYPDSAAEMVQQYHDQVKELMTNYGQVDVLWYDGAWLVNNPEINLAEFWGSAKVNAMARKLQPHILINNRSGIEEDLDTPEQHVTASQPGRGWESCMTIGDSCGWGYIANNPNWKTAPQLLQNLVTAASGEGNFLLNAGPKPNGQIRKAERVRLKAMGDWLSRNGEAIYGSQRPFQGMAGMLGLWTQKGNTAYLHIFRWPGEEAVVACVGTKVKSATLLATGKEVGFTQEHNGRLVFQGLPRKAPDPPVSVIKVQFASKPRSIGQAFGGTNCKVEKDKAAWLEGKAR